MRKILLTCFILSFLTACSSTSLKPQENITKTAYDYIQPKYGPINRSIGNVVSPETINGILSYDSTVGFQPINGFEDNEIESFQNYLIQICNTKNGQIDLSKGLCFDSNNKPIFYAKIAKWSIKIYEKTPQASQYNWEKFLEGKGLFITDETISIRKKEEDIAEKQAKADAERQLELMKIHKEKMKKLPIGTKVCKTSGTTRLIGFIDARNGNKIKILVNEMQSSIRGYYPDFQPHAIWDNQELWDICID